MNKSNRSLFFLILFVVFSCGQQEPSETESNQAEPSQTESSQTEKNQTETTKSESNVQDEKSAQDLTSPESKTDSNKALAGNTADGPCELVLGWDPWEPYQYLTPDNQVKGLEIELIQSMAKQVNCNISFHQGEWVELLEGLKEGTIDLLGGASKTESRKAFAHFSEPYRDESFVLYLLQESVEMYADKSIYELMDEKFRLGITEDYIYGDAVGAIQDKEIYQSQIVTVPITEVNYYNLVQGNIDGFLEDPFVAGYTIKRKGLSSKITASGIKVHSGNVSIMFSKKSVTEERVEAFDIALDAIRDSGEYKKILAKYSH